MASVLITGTSKGIGMATALGLARSGHTVHATMRAPGSSPELGRIASAEKLPIRISTMDVDSDESVKQTIAAIQGSQGPIDVLVNNAGRARTGSIEELGLADFRAVMETNYFGSLRCIQAVLPQMRERRSGCIVNVTSISGRIASPPFAPYTASKFALEALSEVLAQEMKTFNVRVAVVEPGIINTEMAQNVDHLTTPSIYPHPARMAALFYASLRNPVPPSIVADKIREIIETETWQLRHPAGPDAQGFLQFRASMTDEDWIARAAVDDDTW